MALSRWPSSNKSSTTNWRSSAIGLDRNDPTRWVVMKWTRPLCGPAAMSQKDIKTGETMPPQEARPVKHPVVIQKWRWPCLHRPSKGIAVDKQANDKVVHLCRFRKADGLANQAL